MTPWQPGCRAACLGEMMPRCRYFEDVHDYAQDECDRDFCRSVLGQNSKPRFQPLKAFPDPRACEHQWDVFFAKLRVPAHERRKPGWELCLPRMLACGKLVMVDTSFSVCVLCGAIDYHHSELGGPMLCYPRRQHEG
jgi:hypothetical protein